MKIVSMQEFVQSYPRYVRMSLNRKWKTCLGPCPLLGDQARQQAWAEPGVMHLQQHLAGENTWWEHTVVQCPFCHSLFHGVTKRITRNLHFISYPVPFGLYASKMCFEADIPFSRGSLGEEKAPETKSSCFERLFLTFSYLQQKNTYAALVSILSKKLWTGYYCW